MRKIWIIYMLLLCVVFSGCGMQNKEPEGTQNNRQLTEPELSVYMHETGETRNLKLEEYLLGVVAGEMRNDWDINALAAQAIIARTFTLQAYEKGQLTSKGTNASTDIQEFQAYNADAINANVKKAVDMTRGKIATYRGIPIMGWFHASAGGQTASAKEGLDYQYEEPPFVQSVASPDELAPEEIKNWTAVYTTSEVIKALTQMEENISSINTVAIGKKSKSGRATTIVFNGDMEVSAPRLRLALGSMKLKSMLLESVEFEGNKIIFKGHGYGHGVGMSQWGAQKMAIDGKSPEEIVKHYFKDVKIEKRW